MKLYSCSIAISVVFFVAPLVALFKVVVQSRMDPVDQLISHYCGWFESFPSKRVIYRFWNLSNEGVRCGALVAFTSWFVNCPTHVHIYLVLVHSTSWNQHTWCGVAEVVRATNVMTLHHSFDRGVFVIKFKNVVPEDIVDICWSSLVSFVSKTNQERSIFWSVHIVNFFSQQSSRSITNQCPSDNFPANYFTITQHH